MSCVDLDLMQELYFYVLADSVSILDVERRKQKDRFLRILRAKITDSIPDFVTPEWFARRRYAR
jgi:hypothetical protein